MLQKTNMIAVMIPALDSLYYAALTRSIEQRATEAGYSVMFCNSQNDPEKERKSLEMLKTRLVDGGFSRTQKESSKAIKGNLVSDTFGLYMIQTISRKIK